IHGAKTIVVANQKVAAEMSRETGAFRLQHMPVDGVREKVAGDVGVVEALGKSATLVKHAATRDVTAFEALVWHMLEIPESKRIMQRTMLGETLDVITALDLVQHGGGPPVGSRDRVAMLIKIQAPGVAAAFGE